MFSKKIDRFKLLLIAELIMALLLFFTCFQKETKVFTIFGDDMGGQMTETDGYETFSSETFELLPGVYQVRMEVSETEDQTVFAQVRWEQVCLRLFAIMGLRYYQVERAKSLMCMY